MVCVGILPKTAKNGAFGCSVEVSKVPSASMVLFCQFRVKVSSVRLDFFYIFCILGFWGYFMRFIWIILPLYFIRN